MPTSGLILTLAADRERAEQSLVALRADPRFEVGQPVARRLPISLQTESLEEDNAARSWVMSLAGIETLDIVAVYFDEELVHETVRGNTHNSGG